MALRDFRHESPTFRATEVIDMKAGGEAWVLPPGIGHAFYSLAESSLLIGVSHYWDLDDELGCRWDDPAIGIAWPDSEPVISDNDVSTSSVAALEEVTATHRFIS
jgi:dTDP-4-dehydrorhamnose 3,5-epimerase